METNLKENTIVRETAIGMIRLSEVGGKLCQCQFSELKQASGTTSALLDTALQQLEDYFNGQRFNFELPITLNGTAFQQKVWHTLLTIPYGLTCSYQQLARKTGNPKAHRAAGSANAQNPLCIIIPCHRVILASGKPGSYAGGTALKIKLLQLEQQGKSIATA